MPDSQSHSSDESSCCDLCDITSEPESDVNVEESDCDADDSDLMDVDETIVDELENDAENDDLEPVPEADDIPMAAAASYDALEASTNDWNGFKIVGDNLDKLVKTRHI